MVIRNYEIGSIIFSLVSHYEHSMPDDFEEFQSDKKNYVKIELFEDTSLSSKPKISKSNKDYIANEWIDEQGFLIGADYFSGKFDGGTNFELRLHEPYSSNTLVIRNAVRLCIGIYVLAHKKGIFLHSSSVVSNKLSSIFFGLPGSGKSTLARFGKETGLKTQGDEFIFISNENDVFYSYATPFGGEITHDTKKAKVNAIYSIKKGKSFKTKNTSIEEFVPDIVQNEMVCMGVKIKGNMLKANAFYFLFNLCKHVPLRKLIFPYQNDFLKEII